MTHAETMVAIDTADLCRQERRRIARRAGTPEARAAIQRSDNCLRYAKSFLGISRSKLCAPYWIDYQKALTHMRAAAGELVAYSPGAKPLLEVLCTEAE